MMRREKPATPRTEEAVAKGVNYEITIADIARRSEKRAWWVATSAILMAIILACGYFLVLPLKEKVPYLVMADAYTGTATVAKLRWDFDANSIFSSEAINKSNVSHFVVARESFDRSDAIRSQDWVTVNSMAAPDVRTAYRKLFDRANPYNLFSTFQPSEVVRVNLISLQLAGSTKIEVGKKTKPSLATVRFQRILYNTQNGDSRVLDTNVAAVQFIYRDDLNMDDKLRTENPLGFWVTDYRVDKEFVAAPAPQVVQDPQAPSTGAPNPAGAPMPGAPIAPMPGAPTAPAPGTPATGYSAAPSTSPPGQVPTVPNTSPAATPQK